jgi:cell division protein FtsL
MRPIEVRFEKKINNVTLVRESDTRRQWEYVAVTMLGALFVFGLLIYGWQQYQYIQYGYKIEDAQRRNDQLVQKQNVLRLDSARLRNPARIASKAKEMGLVQPAPGQLVPVNPDVLNNPQTQIAAKQ